MPIMETVRAYLVDSEPIVSECRHCGTTVETGVERCPECDKEATPRYPAA